MHFIVKGRTEDDNITDEREDTVVGPIHAESPDGALNSAEKMVNDVFLSGKVYPLCDDPHGDLQSWNVGDCR